MAAIIPTVVGADYAGEFKTRIEALNATPTNTVDRLLLRISDALGIVLI